MTKRWWFSFILVVSSILWGSLVLLLMPIAFASEFPTTQISHTSDYSRLGIILFIILISVLAAIAYFRRKLKK